MTAPTRRAALVVVALLWTPLFASADDEFFEKKIRPLLATQCLHCHSGVGAVMPGTSRVRSLMKPRRAA